MTLSRAVFYEPGHFHAALTLRTSNLRLAPDIHVYATPGPERQAFVTLVESFHTRADNPTHRRLHLHEALVGFQGRGLNDVVQPIFVTISSLRPLFFNDLKNELRFLDNIKA